MIGTRASATDASLIWTRDQFQPHYDAGYVWDTAPPVTEDFQVVFWALGTGDPVIGNGDDNGAFDVTAAGFYYLSYNPYGTAYYYAGELFTGWGTSPLIDGCIYRSGASQNFDGDECTMLLFQDEHEDRGYFALASSGVDANGWCLFNQPGNAPIILDPLPDPDVGEVTGLLSTLVYLDIQFPEEMDGLYLQEGCESEIRFYDLCNETPQGSGVGPDGCAVCGPDEDGTGSPLTPTATIRIRQFIPTQLNYRETRWTRTVTGSYPAIHLWDGGTTASSSVAWFTHAVSWSPAV